MDTNEDTKREDRIRKITALLTKAEDKGCTPEESEAFYAKAQDLMTQWAIDETLLKMGGKTTAEVIKTAYITVPSTYYKALIHLWDQVAKSNDCFVLMSRNGSKCQVVVTGYESDLARLQLMVTSLTVTVLREARAASRTADGDYYFRRSFIESFAYRIGARLREQRDLNVTQSTAPGLGLALIDKREAVKKHVYDTMRVGRARGGASKHSYAGSAAGRAAADRADIGNSRIGGSRRALGQ